MLSLDAQFADTGQRLVNLDKSYTSLETQAEAFHAAQTLQANMQTHLHDQIDRMHTDMHVARRLLAEVTFSASNLQTAIEDTSLKIAQISIFGGFTTVITQCGWVLLVVSIMYQFSFRSAGYATALLSMF